VIEVFRSHDLHRLVEQGVAEGRPHRGEVSIEQGMILHTFELSISPLVLDDGETGAVVVVHNITKIKTLERVRREFVANVSHELRTPLTIINGYLETLIEGGLDDRAMAESALRVMVKHGDRLGHLVEDLLIIAQAESRSVPLDLEPVDLCSLLQRVIEQLDEPIRARGAEVRITSAGGDLVLEADSRRLEQVFLNLLDNALKYGNRPGLNVDLHVERMGPNLHVRVADNGPGIPYEDQEHIFERFYRVHKHRSRETGGTGLGLSIVKNVIQAHGGDVSLQSVPGSGSTFQVTLPVVQPENPSPLPD
jgi:two-component system phosphate regulon sensor histidine kinase PhoR